MIARRCFLPRKGTFTFRRMSSDLLQQISEPVRAHQEALRFQTNESDIACSYHQLDVASTFLASKLASKQSSNSNASIGAFNQTGSQFTIAMLAAWKLGKVFVPLSINHSDKELQHCIRDSKIEVVVCSKASELNQSYKISSEIPVVEIGYGTSLMTTTDTVPILKPINDDTSLGALVVYTSGTTGLPKGVLHSRNGVSHMIKTLTSAWQYTNNDRILHFLPLYHVHGLINKLLCTLWAGGCVHFEKSASPLSLWRTLAMQQNMPEVLTMFMAVPTVYAKLIETAPKIPKNELEAALKTLKAMRLMVCGSAALPDPIMDAWKNLTGETLLERYGMTEIGMALSNPYSGDKPRKKGMVGLPLPAVECRLVDEDSEKEISAVDQPGELRIKGPNVFKEYLNLPAVTAASFDADGWFRTGDVACRDHDGYYRILGRNSTDIIKSSGYKLSALEIEREILSHPQVLEAAVVALPDDITGEKVVALLGLRDDCDIEALRMPTVTSTDALTSNCTEASTAEFAKEIHLRRPITASSDDSSMTKDNLNNHGNNYQEENTQALHKFLSDRLASYKHPKEVMVLSEEIPRNHLGKVNKKKIVADMIKSLK